MATHLDIVPPSDWVQRWAHLVAPGQAILDVACGSGRHTKLFADKGCTVTALDMSKEALHKLAVHSPHARTVQADIENAPWPLIQKGAPETFDAIVVTNYLHRSLMPLLLASLAGGGALIYETFAVGNERFGKPSNPDFLLQPGELLSLCSDMHIVAYEEGFLTSPDRLVQRMAAIQRTTKMQGSSIYSLSSS
jgi:SAM-dependent methyltransferase